MENFHAQASSSIHFGLVVGLAYSTNWSHRPRRRT
jgi:hypothetical protein